MTEDSTEPGNRDVRSDTVVALSVVTSTTTGDCVVAVDWSLVLAVATEVAGGWVTVVDGGRVGCCVVGLVVVGEMTTIGGDDGGNDCWEGGGLVSFGCGAPSSVDEPAYMLELLGST